MSIWFGWGRSQAAPLMTDDEQVEDVSASPPGVASQPASPPAASFDALRNMTNDADRMRGTDPAVAAIWELHERVGDAERKANRFLAKASARREHHEALVAEADALSKLGYQSFEAFAPRTCERDTRARRAACARRGTDRRSYPRLAARTRRRSR